VSAKPDADRIRRYLLGAIEGGERRELDETILRDDEFFESVREIEDDLIDDYVSGDLAGPERQSFETHFLVTADRRHRTELARALRRLGRDVAGPPTAEPQKGWLSAPWRWFPIPAVALAAALLVVAVLLIDGPSRRGDRALPVESTASPSAGPDAASVRGPILAITLSPGRLRDMQGRSPRVVPAGTPTVQLRLEVERELDATPFVVHIETPEGRAVWTHRLPAPAYAPAPDRPIVLDVPANLLQAGDYIVFLRSGAGDGGAIAEYAFSVRR
jgi:hypothetical protein